jgi:uncharacterized protein (TIGR02231 family)
MRRIIVSLFIAALLVAFGCNAKPKPQPPRTDASGTTYSAPETAPETPPATTTATPEGAPTGAPESTTPPESGGNATGPRETVESDEVPIPPTIEAKETPVDSAIASVTVYMDRAAVTRKAKLALDPGAYDLVFSKLPPTVIWDSVRARGSDKVHVVNLKMDQEQLLKPDDPQIKDLTDKIKAKSKEIAAMNDELAVLAKREALLDSIRMRSGEKASQQMEGNIDVAKVGEVMAFLDKQYTDISAQRRDLADKMQAAQEEMSLLQRQFQEVTSKLTVVNIKAVITVMVSEKTDEDIALDYLASGAGWRAEYDLRASAKDDTAELSYFGVVAQSTGEDWKDVQLFLSTTDPNINVVPPVLSVWNIGVWREQAGANAPASDKFRYKGGQPQQAQQQYQNVPVMQRGDNIQLQYEVERLQALEKGGNNALVVNYGERSGVGVNFAIPRKETFLSGKEPHRTIIAVRKLKPKITYIASPRITQKVYMRAEVTNNTPFTLLAGNMSVFFGSDYIGTTQTLDVAPMEMFRVNFGVDQNIKVKRERIKKFEEDTGFTGKTHRITYEYKITLENFKSTDVTVKVVDQIPVSTNDAITVKLVDTNFPTITEEPSASDNKAKGMLEWRAKLPADPKRKNEITYKYYIEYPKGTAISGQE